MATKDKKTPSIDFAALQTRLRGQFEGLNPSDPATWPSLPRFLLCAALTLLVIGLLWFFWLSDSGTELDAAIEKEAQLRNDFKTKYAQAVNIDALRKQREQVERYVTQLERQLPSKSEMDALLSDITQAGVGRNLQFELFRPGQVNVREYYAELPIDVRVTGRYHDIGAFAADVANLSRIVTLNNLMVTPFKEGVLSMQAVAKTYRYLDGDELNSQRKLAGAKK